MNYPFEIITALQYENKALKAENRKLKSGQAFLELKEYYKKEMAAKDRLIRELKQELARSHAETVNVRRYWNEVLDDLDAERKKDVSKAKQETKKMEACFLEERRKNEKLQEKLKEERRQKYEMGMELEELKGLNRKLTAQVNKDFENSSIPSSLQGPGRKKISNSREKTGRKPGGQLGHKGAGRKRHTPDKVIELGIPEKCIGDPDFYATDQYIVKQNVELMVRTYTTEYRARVWRNRKTGERVHAGFPEGIVNEVNYSGSVKAMAFLLGNECNVSHPKVKKFLYEVTGGELDLSIGMINGLCEEFSAKTETEKQKITEKLMSAPIMNADFTNANVNGKSAQVLVLASEQNKAALYIAREYKGHKGILGTPLENYVGTTVHDHDVTFYSYGLRHQECIQHNIRYVKGSIENEPGLEWNHKMLELFREMLHYRNQLGEAPLDPVKVAEYEKRYDEILELGDREYEENPPGDYYREGYNLCLRLRKYKESELLFLHDKRVPADNSLCERLCRVYKRKQKQAMVFRSFENYRCLCDSLSVIYLLRQGSGNVYSDISNIYERKRSRPKTRRKKEKPEVDIGA